MASDLESLQAEADAAAAPDPGTTDPPAAEDAATEEEDVTTPETVDEDSPANTAEDSDADPDPEDDSDSPDTEAVDELDPLGLTKWADQAMPEYGGADAARFKNDQEYLRSLLEARKLVGQRNEDAQTFKQLRDRIGEERLKDLLAEEAALPTKPKPARDANLPRSLEEYSLLQEAAARPDATPAAKDKAAAAQKAFYERLWDDDERNAQNATSKVELAKMVDEKIAKGMAKYTETVEKERAQERTQVAETQWLDKNRAALFVDDKQGSPLTPLGKRVDEISRTDPDVQGLPPLGRWRLALKLATAEQPTPNRPRKPSQRAQRQAPVKTGTPKQKTQQERFDDAPSDAAFLQSEFERAQRLAEGVKP